MQMTHEMSADLCDLSGKIVTGPSRGPGLAGARRMAQHGCKVIISGRKAEACVVAAEQINAEFSSAGGAALAVPANDGGHTISFR